MGTALLKLAQRMLTVQLSDVDIATNMGHASMLLQLPIAPTMANKGIAITIIAIPMLIVTEGGRACQGTATGIATSRLTIR